MRLAFFLALLLAATSLRAQQSPTPSLTPATTPALATPPISVPTVFPLSSPATTPPVPSPSPTSAPRNVALRFALPPLDGTISLGIYNAEGELVRVLHREDAVTDFAAGNDALETDWDGTDDQGKPLPNGKYSAHGYVVGDLKVEGVDYFFNDWVKDEHSPHVARLSRLFLRDGKLVLDANLTGGRNVFYECDQNTGALLGEVPSFTTLHCHKIPTQPNVVLAIDCAAGREGTTWYVDSMAGKAPHEVKQVSAAGEILRRLDYAADDPQPERIEASPNEEKIFLIERNALLERLRALALVRTQTDPAEGAVSDWKTVFDKKIVAHQNFVLENGKPVAASATATPSPSKTKQKLRANPLRHDQSDEVELSIGTDADGSFLQTADGLPLRTISDTANLIRALISRPNDNAIDEFQDDGAVVEEFQISNLSQMMAFDCGSFDLK